jgi:hypothetical protein
MRRRNADKKNGAMELLHSADRKFLEVTANKPRASARPEDQAAG